MNRVMVIRDDFYHPAEIIDPVISKVFDSSWQVEKSDNLRDTINCGESLNLLVLFNTGRNDGEPDITNKEQEVIVNRVKRGMGIMFIHAGLVLIDEQSPFYTKLNSGRFIRHSEKQLLVKTVPIKDINHPILNNVKQIKAIDEHYFCTVNADKVNPLMLSTSEEITSLGAWCSNYGQGRSFSCILGHTISALYSNEMINLLKNAVSWTAEKEKN